MTSEGYFKNLDIDLLQKYAAQWAIDFNYIDFEKIELCRNSPPRRLAKHYKTTPKTLYAVVFHTKAEDVSYFLKLPKNKAELLKDHPSLWREKLNRRYFERLWNGSEHRCHIDRVRGDRHTPFFEKFCSEIGYRHTVYDQKLTALFGEDFQNVYHRGTFPGENYLEQWAFIPLMKGEALPLSVDNDTVSVVLYPASQGGRGVSEKAQTKGTDKFGCPVGTKWEDIKITLIDDDTVRLETPNVNGRYSYHDLGMSDKRSGNRPTVIWVLLKLFAKYQGEISRNSDVDYDPKLTDNVKRLNKHLKGLFGIDDTIFLAHYKKNGAYKTKIFFSDQTIATHL